MSAAPGSPTSWTTGDLARLLGAELIGRSDIALSGLEPMEAAGPTSLTFIRSASYLARWHTCRAGAALVTRALAMEPAFKTLDTSSRAILLVDNADLALSTLLKAITPEPARPRGVSSQAVVHASASVAPDAGIGPFVTIGAGAVIGAGTVLHAGVSIGAGARLGERCELHAGVVVQDRCVIGDRVVLHPGVVIGADGFGYIPAPEGRGLIKIPHAGIVVIGEDVEIGANSCVDRAKLGATTIGAGTKIDNLVQVAHNVRIGRSCIVCGSAAIGGSTVIGDGVTLAGKVAVADNLSIGDRVMVSAYSAVMRDIPAGETWGGSPAQPFTSYMRGVVALRRLPEMIKRISRLADRPGDSGPGSAP